jgi:hypothetical protein
MAAFAKSWRRELQAAVTSIVRRGVVHRIAVEARRRFCTRPTSSATVQFEFRRKILA